MPPSPILILAVALGPERKVSPSLIASPSCNARCGPVVEVSCTSPTADSTCPAVTTVTSQLTFTTVALAAFTLPVPFVAVQVSATGVGAPAVTLKLAASGNRS